MFIERPRFPVDLDQQAWYLPQAFALVLAQVRNGLVCTNSPTFSMRRELSRFGLMRTDLEQASGFYAYNQLIERLVGLPRSKLRNRKRRSWRRCTTEAGDAVVVVTGVGASNGSCAGVDRSSDGV